MRFGSVGQKKRLLTTPMPMMALLMVLPLATARVAAAPPFSWETVPVFAETSNVSGVFDAEALAVLARFPVFVGEKAY